MYTSVSDFVGDWNREVVVLTQQLFDVLTDESLGHEMYPGGRPLGAIAWHIVTNTTRYLKNFGFQIDIIGDNTVIPESANEIAETLEKVATYVPQVVSQQWTDDDLEKKQTAFGRELTNGQILSLLIRHIVHHRGQMTVLMRQAGIRIPGMYGPTMDDWLDMGKTPPIA